MEMNNQEQAAQQQSNNQVQQRVIKNCEHLDELAIFCEAHDMAMCNECYFASNNNYGKGMTLKQAASNQLGQLQSILSQCQESLNQCKDMQNIALNQEGLEEEVLKKVNRQFEQLKQIIDEQKSEAQQIIKHLESVQDYKPPPKNFTTDTLDQLNNFEQEIQKKIDNQKSMITGQKYLQVLKERSILGDLQSKIIQLKGQIGNHHNFIAENSRPVIEVRTEVDKFRGFLHDVISFEPDYILQTDRPRLHYFDEENKQLFIHELTNQTTTSVAIQNSSVLPKEFTSIQAQNKIFFIGGEKKENDIRSVVSEECFLVNESTLQVERKANMKVARSGHQLAHLNRRFEYCTKDFIYAVGSKYPDETSKRCEVYDINKNKWTEIGELTQSRHFHSITVLESRYLYVIGGRDSLTENPMETIERLDGFMDLEKQKWEQLQIVNKDSLWSARDTMGSFALNDSEILIFGGDQGWISDCFCLQTKSGEIERMECSLKKPEEFFRSQPVRYNDKVFCVGCLDKDVHVYQPKAKKWFLLDKWFVDW